MAFERIIGTRAQVWHGTCKKTRGGLTKKHLMKNKHGRIVSRRKHNTAKRLRILEKAGYIAKKGHFKLFRKHKGTRHHRKGKRGGAPYGSSISPHSISGISGTSGVDLQFAAGNAN